MSVFVSNDEIKIFNNNKIIELLPIKHLGTKYKNLGEKANL